MSRGREIQKSKDQVHHAMCVTLAVQSHLHFPTPPELWRKTEREADAAEPKCRITQDAHAQTRLGQRCWRRAEEVRMATRSSTSGAYLRSSLNFDLDLESMEVQWSCMYTQKPSGGIRTQWANKRVCKVGMRQHPPTIGKLESSSTWEGTLAARDQDRLACLSLHCLSSGQIANAISKYRG
ncbi:hypothetical protein LZ32DRAFT_280666 [Colletotrichum eremochloae]|nr:hypothetical protein LZ32DRAFT_280666 [Colletotrichum eremochloae]